MARVKRAADICTPALNQRAIHLALESGQLNEYIVRAQAICRTRRDALLAALRRYLPEAHCQKPAGGLYLWASLPHDGPSATELYLHALRGGVAFAMGPLFFTDGEGAYNLRLNIAAYAPPEIEEGIKRLGTAWKELATGRAPAQPGSPAAFV